MSIPNTCKEVRPIHPGEMLRLNAQRAVDLWEVASAIGSEVERINPLKVAGHVA